MCAGLRWADDSRAIAGHDSVGDVRVTDVPETRVGGRQRICLLTDSPQPSGVGEHMLTLAAGLRTQHDVFFVARGETGLLERAAGLGLVTRQVDPHDPDGLSQWLNLHGVDLAHVHAGIGWEGHQLARAARRAGVPRVVRTEHLPYLLTEQGQRTEHLASLGLVDRVICVSEVSAQSHRQAGVDSGKIAVVLNGVVPTPARRGRVAVRRELGLGQGPVLLMVARFAEQKGHPLLLEAWPEVLEHDPTSVLLLAGEGPTVMPVAHQIAARGLAGSVRLLGQRRDVPDLMAAADLLVLASSFEGLPLVVLEAMAAGLPVVATAAAGTTEAVENQVTGWLSPVGDAPALAGTIGRALSNPVRLAEAGRAGRRRFEERFQAGRMIRETADLYAAVAGELMSAGESQ